MRRKERKPPPEDDHERPDGRHLGRACAFGPGWNGAFAKLDALLA